MEESITHIMAFLTTTTTVDIAMMVMHPRIRRLIILETQM
jgi:hypothetical protein